MKEFYKTIYKEEFCIIVTYFGYVKWSFGGQLDTTCSLDLAEYPFDKQECSIQMENFVYPSLLVSKFFLLPTRAGVTMHQRTVVYGSNGAPLTVFCGGQNFSTT